ncbi:GNAT family N-acetyltransferase [Agromyces archimandritae]|uniref:GNAT family N-acetyltransferase n=1 Tax=Agromyces archimandritae TaxID=2781962 RepID=A0A975IMP1_9MICO|nr:GNAT family N-acetyltransferase [Agromyces archimandritae]QTX03364.1 GNAT family N-acetyltransferase [Agromyces archimandritae]
MHPEPEFRALPPERFDGWKAETVAHLAALRRDSGLRTPEVAVQQAEGIVANRLGDGPASEHQHVFAVTVGGREIGTAWLEVAGEQALLVDYRMSGADAADAAGNEALPRIAVGIERIARELGATRLSVDVFVQDAAAAALTRSPRYEASSIQMVRDPLPDREAPAGALRLGPMTPAEFEAYVEPSVAEFADDLVATGRMTRAEADAESHRQFDEALPDGIRTPGHALYTARADGEDVGILWLGFEDRGHGRHAFVFDVAVHEGHRRRGHGRAIMLAAESEARRHGAASIGLHVFGVNHGAIALYEGLGYRALEVLRVARLDA